MKTFIAALLAIACLSATVQAQPEISINIPAYTLTYSDNGNPIKSYNIAVGTPYEQTPVGSFRILLKEEYPTWYPGANFTDRTPVPPGPDNPLGTRWMEFSPGYGIHGTNKGWDISYPVSGGCVRMQDADARELFEKVAIGTPVTISYQTMFLIEKKDGLYLRAYPDIYNRHTNTQETFQRLFDPYADRYWLPREIKVPDKIEEDTVYEAKIAVPRSTKL